MIIYQPESGYCYNSDTIFLYDFISSLPIKGKVLDIGTGSGILALMVARDFKSEVVAIEFQEHFVSFANINAKINRLPVKIIFSDFCNMIFKEKFDFIISNPPFYHKNVLRSKDPRVDRARYSGFLPMDIFFKKASTLLKPKGGIAFCYDAKQIQELLYFMHLYKLNLKKMQFLYPSLKKGAKLVMCYAQKNSNALCEQLPPFIVFNEEGNYTPQAQKAFQKAEVYSIKCKL